MRIIPEAPTKAPATIKIILFTIKPADIAAIPDKEFRNAITTGISAPPITTTLTTPPTSAIAINNSSTKNSKSQTAGININGGRNAEKIFAIVEFTLFNFPRSLSTAIKLPENVNIPTTIEKIATK